MEIKGYKAFNHDLTNRYGEKFNEGVTYYVNGPIKYGNNGNIYKKIAAKRRCRRGTGHPCG